MNSSEPRFSDFFGLWTYGSFAIKAGTDVSQAVRDIYSPEVLSAYQHKLDPALPGSYPFFYPPTILLLLIPLGMLPLPTAYAVWMVSTFSAYMFSAVGRKWLSTSGLWLLVAPTTLLTVISGQNGFLSAALLVGGLRSLANRPVLSGIFFGVLTYKPTLIPLIPVVLIASGRWTTVIASCLTVAVAVLTSSIVLGMPIWPTWMLTLPLQEHTLRSNLASMAHTMPTLIAGAYSTMLPLELGSLLQLAFSAIVVTLTWRNFRRGISSQGIAMAILGTTIVAPHLVIYDLPMVSAAVSIYWKRKSEIGRPFNVYNVSPILLLYVAILSMVTYSLPFVAPILLFIVFLMSALP